MRILIVCEHASARFGGEAILPLHWFSHLMAAGDETWLLSHERTRQELIQLFPGNTDRLFFAEDTRLQKKLHSIRVRCTSRILQIILDHWIHLITQLQQRRIAKDLVTRQKIDWVLEPMPVSPRQPSLMFGLGAPVIIGPMNGGMSFPPGFREMENWLDRVTIPIARHLSALAHFLAPGKRRARLLLVANERTRNALPWSLRKVPTLTLVENAVDLNIWRSAQPPTRIEADSPNRTFGFAFVGRLVDWKAVDILIEAFEEICTSPNVTLDIFGDGPMREALETQASDLMRNGCVMFHGFVPQHELPDRLAGCDCLVLPSLYECGGAVVLEAMALGIPVIAADWGGPSDYLDSSCGILIYPTDRTQFRSQLAHAMRSLIDDPESAERLATRAKERVAQSFTWAGKAHALRQILLSQSLVVK